MPQTLAIWGASGHAKVVADAVRIGKDFHLIGFLDDNRAREGESFDSTTVLGGREVLGSLLERAHAVHIAVGHCRTRLQLSDIVLKHGLSLATVVHPHAIGAADVSIGAGTFLAAGAIVNAAASIGRSVILNTSCSVDHECVIEDGVHIGPGARLGGLVHVGRGAWIAIGAIISNGVRIGARSIVGAGAVVLDDIPEGVVAFGVPARIVRDLRENE